MREKQGFLFEEAPAPPTGPTKIAPDAEANHYTVYCEWRETEEGKKVWEFVVAEALLLARAGEKRISVNALCEQARHKLKALVNNTYRAWIADDLVVQYPELLPVIERRRRTKAKNG
jgi:hypothetical protein